jgi:aminopeptidase-like protein
MNISEIREQFDAARAGAELHAWARAWFPIPRSLTGDGIRQQLREIAKHAPLQIREAASGTPVFDWTVPKEWNVRAAWIKAPGGEKIADFSTHPLHLLGYSVPFSGILPLAKLKEHCFTLPDQPTLIPYRTSYYSERWGFCLPHYVLNALPEGDYEVHIDTTLEDGHLSYGELALPGLTKDEVLISAHACHPGLANDNLSGLAIATWLARALASAERRYTYRFIFAPGTIGAITWLAHNEQRAHRIKHGLVLACLGDAGHTTYKMSRQGDAPVDRAARHVLEHSGTPFETQPFVPYGYDERQYNSPGFDLPVGCFMRTPPGQYPEYHTSADNLDLISPEALADSLEKLLGIIEALDGDAVCMNLAPKCEPMLGKRGLYGSLGGTSKDAEMALLWVLNFSDGAHSLLDIAERADLPFATIRAAADRLIAVGLLDADTPEIVEEQAPAPIDGPEEVAPQTGSDFWDDFLDDGGDKRKPGEAAQDDDD